MSRDAQRFASIADHISQTLGRRFTPTDVQPCSGGCINQTWMLQGGTERFFVKLNVPQRQWMFDAERDGLDALAACNALRVPRPLCCGKDDERSWLVLEYLEFGSLPDWGRFGEGLARQHRCTSAAFGWHRDNVIGATPQLNAPLASWPEFFRRHRLAPQFELASRNGHTALQDRGTRLLERLDAFFAGDPPLPSLLHGDLWSGNAGFLGAGEPVIYDPAVYYGDREADLAMTELFGGFPAEFGAAYRAAWPLDAGYALRRRLYNLYHLLNHLNLFGPDYLARCRSEIDWLLAQA